MSQRIVTADWAAQVPFSGITDLPDWLKPGGTIKIDLSQINQSGASDGQVVTWSKQLGQYVPRTPSSSSSGGSTIKAGDSPAIATRKRPNGQPGAQFEDIWFRWEYNVRLYGATGNGATSDANAVAQAKAALTAAGGGSLYFPAGTYMGMENMGAFTVPTSIRGDGIGQTILNFGTNGGIALGAGACELRALTLQACKTAVSCNGGTLFIDGIAINAFDMGVLLTDSFGGYIHHSLILGGGSMTSGITMAGASSANDVSDVYISAVSGPAITCGTGSFDNRVDNIAFISVTGNPAVLDQGNNNYINELYGLGGNTDPRWENRKELVAYHTWSPCSMSQGAGAAEDVLVPGARLGDQVILGPPYSMDYGLFSGYVRAPDTVRMLVMNIGASVLNPGSGVWKVRVIN